MASEISAPIVIKSNRTRTLGLVGLLWLSQAIIYLAVWLESPILPGNWSTDWQQWQQPMLYYILFMGMIVTLEIAIPKEIGTNRAGTIGNFTLTFMAGGTIMWIATTILTLAIPGYFGAPGPNDTSLRLSNIVFYVIFVAVAEEFGFRTVLPLYAKWKGRDFGWAPATLGFGIFHLPAYALGSVGKPWFILWIHVGVVMALGLVFYLAYKRFGFGMAVGLHAGFNLAASGVIGNLQIF